MQQNFHLITASRSFPSRGSLFVSFRAVGTIFEDENVHRGISFFEPLSAKTLARIDFFLLHTCQSLKGIRLRGGDPSVKLCGFGLWYCFRDDRFERTKPLSIRNVCTKHRRSLFVSFRAVGTSFEDAEYGARNLLPRTAFGLSLGKDSFLFLTCQSLHR